MARNIYGLDLGTYEIKVYDKKQDSTTGSGKVVRQGQYVEREECNCYCGRKRDLGCRR